ncbi:MAG: hypothetical protein JNL01_15145 [Bdellovibrionales bacterium]|nr:hypothetical protein [Bdellovibrionales bacterium]
MHSFSRSSISLAILSAFVTLTSACGNISTQNTRFDAVKNSANQLTRLGVKDTERCMIIKSARISELAVLGKNTPIGPTAEAHRQKLVSCGEDAICVVQELSRIITSLALVNKSLDQSRKDRIVRLTSDCKDEVSCLIPTNARNLRTILREETDWKDAAESETAMRLISETEGCTNLSCFASMSGQMLRQMLSTRMKKTPADFVLADGDEAIEKMNACSGTATRSVAQVNKKPFVNPNSYYPLDKEKLVKVRAESWVSTFIDASLYLTSLSVSKAIDGFALIEPKDEGLNLAKKVRTVESNGYYITKRWMYFREKNLPYYQLNRPPTSWGLFELLKKRPEVLVKVGDQNLVEVALVSELNQTSMTMELTFPYAIVKDDFRAIRFQISRETKESKDWKAVYLPENPNEANVEFDEIVIKLKTTLTGADSVKLILGGTPVKDIQVSKLEAAEER